jgi:hypothetical protein
MEAGRGVDRVDFPLLSLAAGNIPDAIPEMFEGVRGKGNLGTVN